MDISKSINSDYTPLELSKIWGSSDEEKGEVFTNPDVVELMLITSGICDCILDENTRILEPSCGQGEFVLAIVKIMCAKIITENHTLESHFLKRKIKAYDISSKNIEKAKQQTKSILLELYSDKAAQSLVDEWFVCGDFLLLELPDLFTHIIGNPPYIRIENIPKKLLLTYRQAFSTMAERADIYVAFFEKALKLLKDEGKLSFICTDRWVRNKYGKKLRSLIGQSFNLDLYIDLYDQKSFQSDVLTYPAITIFSKSKKKHSLIVHNKEVNNAFTSKIYLALKKGKENSVGVFRNDVVNNEEPWLLGGCAENQLIRKIERKFLPLEDEKCRVYIGAATGNNDVYIVDDELDIEDSRKIPVVKAQDLKNGKIRSSNSFMINTYDEEGVINLSDYPLLEEYLESHKVALSKRHVAKNKPDKWFKTIDKVHPDRAYTEKLLIPDIKSKLTVVYDSGEYHPNNSIYYIRSESWDLNALKAVLTSGIGQLFVQAYSTKIAGGNLRFQAQHLRRIRIPSWESINVKLRKKLIKAGERNNQTLAVNLVAELYSLSVEELQIIGG